MKIVFTSDLHIGLSESNWKAAGALAAAADSLSPDVFVIAGDVGETMTDLERGLGLFSSVEAEKLFVAGNHDVWIEGRGAGALHSREKYSRAIPEVCRRLGFTDLSRGPRVLGDIGFVGSIGWYDYAFADPRLGLTEADYRRGHWRGEVWLDAVMTSWPALKADPPARAAGAGLSAENAGSARDPAGKGGSGGRLGDAEVCSEMIEALERDVREIEPSVSRIVAVIHTLPFQMTLPRSDPPAYQDAFTGSDRIGRVLERHPKVTHCICAHKHSSGNWTVGGIHVHRRALGALREDTPVATIVKRALGIIEI